MSHVIAAAALPVSLWANKAGRKADIAAGEGWLVGFAWLDQDAPFSDYAGSDRTIMLLEGTGFELALPAGRVLAVRDRFAPAAFDGAGPIGCHLLGGACRVLNAISSWPGLSHTMQVMTGAQLAAVQPGERVFVVVLRGQIGAAGPLDTVRLTAPITAADDTLAAVIRIEQELDR